MKAKPKAKAAVEDDDDNDDDDIDDEPAPKAKAKPKAKAAAQDDDDDDDDDDDTPAPKAKAKPKAKAVITDEEDEEDEEEEVPPAKRRKSLDVDDGKKKSDELTVYVGGLPWSAEEQTVKKNFEDCGEIERFNMPKNDEGRPRGCAFITYTTDKGVEEALKFNNTDYGGRTIRVNKASEGAKGKGEKGEKGKGKGMDGKGKGDRNDELTVFVGGLSYDVTEETFKKDFTDCGEIASLRFPLNANGKARGFAFVEYKNEEGMKKAMEFNETEYAGRWLSVKKAGDKSDKGKGKGKDGKDGGKDKGKGKGKGKKGKKGGLSEEKKAAKDGAMVESTGNEHTFDDDDDDDHDDDDEPATKKTAPKKAAKKVEESDDDDDDE